MAYQYKLDYGGHSVTLESDEELTDEEIQDAAEQSFSGVSDAAPKKSPSVMDMIAPGYNRELTDAEKTRQDEQVKMLKANPYDPYAAYNLADPRPTEVLMQAVNAGTRAVGAAIPSAMTRGTNEDGSTKSFGEAMADPNTGLFRPIREKYEQRFGENLTAMKEATNPFDKVLSGVAAGLDGIGLLASSALEPGVGSIAKAFGRASKFSLTLGKSAAQTAAQTYLKETGVSEAALQRLAEEGGAEAIKKASHEVDTDWRSVVENHIQAIKQPQLEGLSKEEKKVFEGYQERLAEILDKKHTATAEAQAELDGKLMQLDQEVRDFVGNISSAKESKLGAIKQEGAAGKEDIAARAESEKNLAAQNTPGQILGDEKRADALAAGDKIQGNLQAAESKLSDRYGELKNEGFGFSEARDKMIPGKNNVVEDAWKRVRSNALSKYGEGAISPKDDAAFQKLLNDHAPGTGPSTLGGLLNTRKHIGKVIYGKTGIKESDELFRGVNRNVKEDFYHALNDEIGTQLHGFYRSKGIPPEVASQLVDSWDEFNNEYANIRKGLETVESGLGFKSSGGRTERYAAGLDKMGVNDLKKAKAATMSAEATRPVWEALQGAYINRLIDQATVGETFSPKKFGSILEDLVKNDRERLVTILGEAKVNELVSYNKRLAGSLEEIDAASKGDLDALAKSVADKIAATRQKTGTAANAVAVYKKAQTNALRGETAASLAEIRKEAASAAGEAKTARNAAQEAIDKRRAEIEAIGTIVTGKSKQSVGAAMTQANMTGPKRKQIVDKLVELYGPEEAQKIQDAYFAKSIGASKGSIPLMTRMPTGRSLFLGFITGHPLAAALATSPQVAAAALRYGSKPAGRMGQAIQKVVESQRLVNLFKMLDGVKKVESRNRIILRIAKEMQAEGIELPEEQESAVAPEGQ